MTVSEFSVIDSAGNAVSITYTLNGLWGSGVAISRSGVLMNDEMDEPRLSRYRVVTWQIVRPGDDRTR